MDNYDSISYRSAEDEKRKFLTRTYGWMALALVISAASAFITANSPAMLRLLFGNRIGFWVVAIAEIALVFYLSAAIGKMSISTAIISFVVYSVLNGVTLSSIFLVYSGATIAYTFLASAAMFGGMCLYGVFTKQNLASAGKYLIMAVWGIIIMSLLNLFFKSNSFSWLLSLVTVVVFVGLTAYDSQKILNAAKYSDGSDTFKKASIIGALQLYLDFINIFLALLRLFGGRRN